MKTVHHGFFGYIVLVASAAALVLAGCGTGQPGTGGAPTTPQPPPATQVFNDADVTFAQQMIPHHQQAIQMSQMVQARSQNPQVKELAGRIEAAQQPEIQTMTGWLQSWGKPVPTMGPGMMQHQPGMPSMEDMSRMMGTSGPDFDRMFLQMMIAHHEGAVQMAKTEQAQGQYPDAKQLARNIETSQTAEIAEMQQMLGGSTR
ncbi:DUF305 domain-containing protein [Saccharopolyspora phatthalungensis]|uniref:Uncharacterized protein (DUF305 family) n=1 Tax=Saccharopolyspora phatthalungensis TaxID=664693 RepID=A0A840Q4S4_9PSEU|nr:DUF305 domain-containing protein [Saccharopolyspora phatthalungensis]MBB5157502.1 uncharacterized protein (DUF305 family) [Saccharopolyspora phatthalungensis]